MMQMYDMKKRYIRDYSDVSLGTTIKNYTTLKLIMWVEWTTHLRPSIPFSIYSGMRSSFDLHAECMRLCYDVGVTQLSVFS